MSIAGHSTRIGSTQPAAIPQVDLSYVQICSSDAVFERGEADIRSTGYLPPYLQ